MNEATAQQATIAEPKEGELRRDTAAPPEAPGAPVGDHLGDKLADRRGLSCTL
jgi:hypothetical protein